MPRPWPVHLIAVTVLVGLMLFVFQAIGPALPDVNRVAVLVLTVGYAVVSLALVVLRGVLGVRLVGLPQRLAHLFVNGAGGVVVIADFWLLAPYAEVGVRLVMLVYQVGTVTIQVVNAVQPPPSRRTSGLPLLALPLSMALYFLVHWEPYSLAIIPFAITYGYLAWALRGLLQRAVDRTYEARRAAESALAQVAAERDAKARFLTSASHDLGQPLQAARLFFDQAMRAGDPAQRERAASRVSWALDNTEHLLRRILDHLRLESGAVEAHVEPVAVGPLIARIAEMNEPAARLAGTSIRALPSRLAANADPELAERALGNLVGNAIRHAKGRRVLVGARRVADRIRLWVIDDGVGISEADAPRLFDDYVQGSDHGDEVRGGFGLGLASARRMADLMGASVGLEPKWAKGSAFWLDLPAAGAKAG